MPQNHQVKSPQERGVIERRTGFYKHKIEGNVKEISQRSMRNEGFTKAKETEAKILRWERGNKPFRK